MTKPYFSGALRLPRPIGRENEEQEIRSKIVESKKSHILHLLGDGGIGKSMLLQQVREWCPRGVICSTIIDLYVVNTNSRVEQAIISSIVTPVEQEKYFRDYSKYRREFERARLEGHAPVSLAERARKLTQTFIENYNSLAKKKRVVLLFDTTEAVQFEVSEIESAHGIELPDIELKTWLLEVLPRLENTIVILAGRPEPKELVQSFKGDEKFNAVYQPLPLKELREEHTLEYFDLMIEEAKKRVRKEPDFKHVVKNLPPRTEDERRRIHQIAEGRPIFLAMYIDFIVFSLDSNIEVGEDFINRLREFKEPIPTALRFLGLARKGIDEALWLIFRKEPKWEPLKRALRNLSFVKFREGGKIYLHDYIYDLMDKHNLWGLPERSRWLGQIIKYYEEGVLGLYPQRHKFDVQSRIWDLRVEQLYYELLLNPDAGFKKFLEWDEEAIAQRWVGYDMRLRDEVARFLKKQKEVRHA